MDVRVRRSARRKKTVQARLVDGVLEIALPGHMTKDEEDHWVGEMTSRFSRRVSSLDLDLEARAASLSRKLRLPMPDEIVWSERQKTLWGSCTPATRRVRISTRIAGYPGWVIDYVIVHELAHLAVPDHGESFWKLVNRYSKADKAQGYLEAKSDGL